MKRFFSPVGQKALKKLGKSPALYAFDYDGTLSPIVSDSAHAILHQETHSLLRELCKRASVAIISGRGLKDLKTKFDFKPCYFVGNHGIEGLGISARKMAKAIQLSKKWKLELDEALAEGDCESGIEVESKKYSLSIHYRRTRNQKKAAKEVFAALKILDPRARLIFGKCVVNVVPRGFPHKGGALLALMKKAKLRAAFFAGDDDTDEDVFTLKNSNFVTLRVGRSARSKAKFFIARQAEMNRVLKQLLSVLKPAK